DFQATVLTVDGAVQFGDVEIHRTTTEWTAHGHGTDRRYGRVVLHVVYESTGRAVYHRDRPEAIPELALRAYIPPAAWSEFPVGVVCGRRPMAPMCLTYLSGWDAEALRTLVEYMGYLYLGERARSATQAVATGEVPAQTLYRSLARGLGYVQAKHILESLARDVDWPTVRGIALGEGPEALVRLWWNRVHSVQLARPGPYRPAQGLWRRLAWLAVLCGLPDLDPMGHLLQVAEAGLRHGAADPAAWRRLWRVVTQGYTGLTWPGSRLHLPDGRTIGLRGRLVGPGRWTTLWWNAVMPVAMALWERAYGAWPSLEALRALHTGPIEDDAIQRAVRARFGLWQSYLPRRSPLVQLGLHGFHSLICNEPVRSCPRCPLRSKSWSEDLTGLNFRRIMS
ncbi:MAG: DUF2851 family protein, partial [Acidobacteria bacterium]|nr:DUF2851 family protein [Acidobacteriota bacterium]MDW7985105.1 DUF2851 family protein [Acidobacteriota bacterium]